MNSIGKITHNVICINKLKQNKMKNKKDYTIELLIFILIVAILTSI